MQENLVLLEKQLQVQFLSKDLFENVFIHRSFLNEQCKKDLVSNERLEFLGDAVLELITTEYLYKKYESKSEGELTAIRSALVRREHLARSAKLLDLGKYLKLSKGELLSGGAQKDYILANTVEALIGALYLDQGMESAVRFVHTYILFDEEHIVAEKKYIDSKSKFQETAQEQLSITPHYQLVEDLGPDHDKKFVMGVYLGDEKIAEGVGTSKRKAEEDAAFQALRIKGWL